MNFKLIFLTSLVLAGFFVAFVSFSAQPSSALKPISSEVIGSIMGSSSSSLVFYEDFDGVELVVTSCNTPTAACGTATTPIGTRVCSTAAGTGDCSCGCYASGWICGGCAHGCNNGKCMKKVGSATLPADPD